MSSISQRKITVVGAGFVGMTSAQLCAQKELAGEVVLIDVLEGRPQGIALDLNQMAAVENLGTRVIGTNDLGDTADSDLFIVTAGKPRTPGMSRSDLLEVNGRVVDSVAKTIREGSPNSIVIVVTNPLDIMTHLMRVKTGFSPQRVVGMAGVLDSARYSWFIAEHTGTSVADVDSMVLGAHGDSMVPMPKYCTVNGVTLTDLADKASIDAMSDRTRHGGAEIVKLLKTGSAYYAPAAASVAMAKSILNDERRLLPSCCMLNGHFGFEGIYMGSPAVLGKNGVEKIIEVPLDTDSRALMQKTAGAIASDIESLREAGIL